VDNNLNFASDDFAFIGDCTKSSIFRVINVLGGPSLTHGGLGSQTFSLETAKVRRAIYDIYYIGDTGRQDGNGNTIYGLFQIRNGQANEISPSTYLLRFNYGITQHNQQEAQTFNNFSSVTDPSAINFVNISVLNLSHRPTLTQDDTNSYQMLDTTINFDSPELIGYERYLKRTYSFNVRTRNSI